MPAKELPMSQETFVEGDVVQLKSGGQLMTVQGPGTTAGHVFCEWIKANGEPDGLEFKPSMLVKVNPGDL